MSNLLHDRPDARQEEIFEPLWQRPGLKVERIVTQGQSSPEGFWYQQDWEEWVLVVQGAAELEFEGGDRVQLERGGYHLIPAGVRHRVAWSEPKQVTVWLAIHAQAEQRTL